MGEVEVGRSRSWEKQKLGEAEVNDRGMISSLVATEGISRWQNGVRVKYLEVGEKGSGIVELHNSRTR